MYDVLHASDTLNELVLPFGLPLGLEVVVGLGTGTLGSMHLSPLDKPKKSIMASLISHHNTSNSNTHHALALIPPL